jgi:hypothetical protein
MEVQEPYDAHKKLKRTVHLCPQCGYSIELKGLGLPGGATGFVTCRKYDWSPPIGIKIVDKESAD